jgi:hypothetical protein
MLFRLSLEKAIVWLSKKDTLAFVKKFKLLADRETDHFRSLNHQMGFFYDKQNKQKTRLSYYISLDKATDDDYLVASNYRNRNMYFKMQSIPLQLNIMIVH